MLSITDRQNYTMLNVSNSHLLGTYHVHSTQHPLYSVMVTAVLWDWYCHPHFIDEKTDMQKV